MRLHNIRGHVYKMFGGIFEPCFKTWLHCFQKYRYVMFVTCLHNIWRHVCTIFEELLVWKNIYVFFLDIIIIYLKTCLSNVWRYNTKFSRLILIIFQGMFSKSWFCTIMCTYAQILMMICIKFWNALVGISIGW